MKKLVISIIMIAAFTTLAAGRHHGKMGKMGCEKMFSEHRLVMADVSEKVRASVRKEIYEMKKKKLDFMYQIKEQKVLLMKEFKAEKINGKKVDGIQKKIADLKYT